MNNNRLIDKKWENTDKLIKKLYALTHSLKKYFVNELTTLPIDEFTNLNQKATTKQKYLLTRKIKEWRKEGYLNGYFGYMCTRKINTYAQIVELLITALYIGKYKTIEEISKNIYEEVANDHIKQAFLDRKKEPLEITYNLDDLLYLAVINQSFVEYMQVVAITDANEIYKKYINAVRIKNKVNDKDIKNTVDKQFKKLINVNNEKQSGTLVQSAYDVGNKAYIEPFKEEENLKVRFIAVIDSKTTAMCRSLNNKIFYVNKINNFERYSSIDKKIVSYSVEGLVQGVNAPPIDNHFHWCRSTITYRLEDE